MTDNTPERVNIKPCCGGHEVCFDHCITNEDPIELDPLDHEWTDRDLYWS